MSAQLLGPKWLRRIGRATGETIVRGWAHGGYVFAFVTAEHRHGEYDRKTGEVQWLPDGEGHYSSCYDDFWPEHLRVVRRFPPGDHHRCPGPCNLGDTAGDPAVVGPAGEGP